MNSYQNRNSTESIKFQADDFVAIEMRRKIFRKKNKLRPKDLLKATNFTAQPNMIKIDKNSKLKAKVTYSFDISS